MSAPRLQVIESAVSGEISLTEKNLLAESQNLDGLVFWEKLLDRRRLDYCIVQSGGIATRPTYQVYTDMDQFLQGSGRQPRAYDIVENLLSEEGE